MTLARVVHNQIEDQGGEIAPAVADRGLEAWARKAQLAFDVARGLALTPFVPSSLVAKKTDENNHPVIDVEVTTGNVLGALLAGDELGLEPMAALRSIDIIQGVPAIRANAQRGVVQAAGHELVVEQSNATSCVVKGRRKGSKEWSRSRWDMDRAKALGLAGKENWRKQPTAMLLARATAECARMIASDALLGMPYAVEELDDGDVSAAGPVEESAPPRRSRTARRRDVSEVSNEDKDKPADDPEPEPGFDGETPSPAAPPKETSGPAEGAPPSPEADPDPASPPPEPVTDKQLRAIHATFRDMGISERNVRMAYASNVLGRDLPSSKDMTAAEASRLLEVMKDEQRSAAAGPAEPPFEDVPLPDEPPLDEG